MWFDKYNLITIKDKIFFLPIGQYEVYIDNKYITFYLPQDRYLFVAGLKITGHINMISIAIHYALVHLLI